MATVIKSDIVLDWLLAETMTDTQTRLVFNSLLVIPVIKNTFIVSKITLEQCSKNVVLTLFF